MSRILSSSVVRKKGNNLKSSPGRSSRKKSVAVCVAEELSSYHTN